MHGGETTERTSADHAPAAPAAPVAPVAPAADAVSRPRWWTQVLVVAAVWYLYDFINNLAPLRAARAMANGVSILDVETLLHLDAERWMNRWLSGHDVVGRWLGSYYNLAHFAVTAAVLVWVWWRHPTRYRLLRAGLLGINAIGFVVYWTYPVAPPRMLAGFTDTVAVTHALGGWTSGGQVSLANEFAAMPSLHVAWALWCAVAVWAVRPDRRARGIAVAYVALTTVAVMATANHYFLDVAAGAATAVAALGLALTRGLLRRSATSQSSHSQLTASA